MNITLSRRDFIKIASFGAVGSLITPWRKFLNIESFPEHERLGRVCDGTAVLKAKPDYDSETIGTLYEDTVVSWLREVRGAWQWRNNQRWVETPDGYIWSPQLQPVNNYHNSPIVDMPVMEGEPGMWVEVTVPYVDAILENPPARSRWLRYRIENGMTPRFYYSQIFWIDDFRIDDDGLTWYRINERYGSPGDIFWARAEAFRPLTADELSPISPNVEDKKIIVDVNYGVQTLSCFEGGTEVYFCRISSGKLDGSTPITPTGTLGFPIWRKLYSLHMAGGTNADGWDLPGIAWTSLFVGDGVAIHSTFWHNNFGEPMSHGCVNASPDDAKWIFRWTQPSVPFASGDITISGSGSTRVIVKQW